MPSSLGIRNLLLQLLKPKDWQAEESCGFHLRVSCVGWIFAVVDYSDRLQISSVYKLFLTGLLYFVQKTSDHSQIIVSKPSDNSSLLLKFVSSLLLKFVNLCMMESGGIGLRTYKCPNIGLSLLICLEY